MKYNKEDLMEILRLWEIPQLNEALDNKVSPHDIVIPHNRDILLEAILRKSEPLFVRVLSMPFDFNKNKFLYLHHAVRNVLDHKEAIFIEKLLEVMDEDNIHKKDPHSGKTALHIACELNLQESALLLSKKGLSWNDETNNKQTPLHLLLRNAPYVEKFLMDELTKANISKKDNMDLSCKDIIKSFAFDSDWASIEENQSLLKKLKI
jgi:Ankyrin repeats (3 copies)